MSAVELAPHHDERLEPALTELRRLIQGRYPGATFRVGYGEDDDDPDVIHLYAYVDVGDTDEVMDILVDRLVDMQIDGLPIFVIPLCAPGYDATSARAHVAGTTPG